MKIILVAGARPNFMKIAPIIREINRFNSFHLSLFTGMPNQTNQINQIDQINEHLTSEDPTPKSFLLFTPSPDANENLKKEGIPEEKIFLVGNVMVDSLLYNLEKAQRSSILYKLGLADPNQTNQRN